MRNVSAVLDALLVVAVLLALIALVRGGRAYGLMVASAGVSVWLASVIFDQLQVRAGAEGRVLPGRWIRHVSSTSGASVRGSGPAVTLASGGAASDAPRLSLHRADVPRVVAASVSSARGPGNEPAERPAPGCSSPLAFPGPRAVGADDDEGFVQCPPAGWRAW